jgi:hypothetical protein
MRRAWILTAHGELAHGYVCARCAIRAVVVVPPAPATIAPACRGCKQEPAAFCASCFARACQQVQELSAANVVLGVVRPKPPA